MKIPPDVNTRAEEMWRIISQEVDFRKKRVIDLGCGHGEMLWRAYVAGAEIVVGVDKNIEKDNLAQYPSSPMMMAELVDTPVWKCKADINMLLNTPSSDCNYDIGFSFSVLPYLGNFNYAIQWMASAFKVSIIEAQYAPEPHNVGVASDRGMTQLLVNNGFKEVKPLGKTYVDIRETYRTIFECKG